jgi:hypothetical protein
MAEGGLRKSDRSERVVVSTFGAENSHLPSPPFDGLEKGAGPLCFSAMSASLRLLKGCSSAVAVSRTRAGKLLLLPYDHTTVHDPFHSDDQTIGKGGDLLFNNRDTLKLGKITFFARTYAMPDAFRFHSSPLDHESAKRLWKPVGGPCCARKRVFGGVSETHEQDFWKNVGVSTRVGDEATNPREPSRFEVRWAQRKICFYW